MADSRFHAFDTLRAGAMLLGIFFHGAISFMEPASGFWPVYDSSRSPVASAFVWASHGFRLQIFFVMSGFFAHMLFHRYGTRRFLMHRVKRVLVPFAVGVVVLDLIIRGYAAVGSPGMRLTFDELHGGGAWGYLQALDSAHFWFLIYLAYLSAGMLALRAGLMALFGSERWGGVDRAFRALVSSPWRPVAWSVPVAAMMLWHGAWVLDGPAGDFAPDARWIAYYGLFFGTGWLLHRHVDLLDVLPRNAGRYLAIAAPVGVAGLAGVAISGDYAEVGLLFPATMIFSSLFTCLMVFGTMGLFLRTFGNESALGRYLSDSAYWLYLAHIPVVVSLQSVIAGFAGPWPIKYLVVTLGSTALLLLSYEFCVRYTFIGTTLNGPRERATPLLRSLRSGGRAGA